MAYMPQRGIGQARVHLGPNPVAVWSPPPPTPTFTRGPAPVPVPAPSNDGGPIRNPYTTGTDYAYWVTQAYGAPGTARRNAVPMSCLMGGINCPSGMGDYDRTGDYEWMFNPPPFNFLNPQGVTPAPGMYAPAASMGLGCACGCSPGPTCNKGMGQAATGLFGTSLFASTDFTQWGIGEWGIIALAAYLAVSVFGDVKTVQKKVRRRSSRSKRRQKLLEEAGEL